MPAALKKNGKSSRTTRSFLNRLWNLTKLMRSSTLMRDYTKSMKLTTN